MIHERTALPLSLLALIMEIKQPEEEEVAVFIASSRKLKLADFVGLAHMKNLPR